MTVWARETAIRPAPTPPTNRPRHGVARPLSHSRPKSSRPNQNVLLSRLNEQHRRWYVALEAERRRQPYCQYCTPQHGGRQGYRIDYQPFTSMTLGKESGVLSAQHAESIDAMRPFVISVDTKNKELIGNFANQGRSDKR